MNNRCHIFVALFGAAFLATAHAQQLQCAASAGVPPVVRAEGLAELVGDLTLTCTGGTPTAAGAVIPTSTVSVFLNTNITSRLLTATGGFSEALLLIDEPHSATNPNTPLRLCGDTSTNEIAGNPSVCQIYGNGNGLGVYSGASGFGGSAAFDTRNRPNVFQGRQSGVNSLEWQVPIDPPGVFSTRVIRVLNVRANANQLGVSNTLTPTAITMFISIAGAASVPVNNPTQTVAFSQRGVVSSVLGSGAFVQSVSQNPALATGASSAPNPNAYTGGDQGFQFMVRATENFVSAFKRLNTAQSDPFSVIYPFTFNNQSIPGVINDTEDGFINTLAAIGRGFQDPPGGTVGATPVFPDVRGMRSAGAANHGTRLIYQFNNIPAGVILWVPGAVRVDSTITGLRTGTARLVSTDANGAGAFVPIAANPSGYVQLSVFNGVATAVFEILYANPNVTERVDVPVAVAYVANPGLNLPTPDVQSTASAGLAPLSFNGVASTVSSVPRFASSSGSSNTFIVTRPGAGGPITVSPTSMTTSSSEAQLNVSVTTSSSQQTWTAVSNVPWLTINSGSASGTGSGTVRITQAANTLPVDRTGTLTIAGTTVTVAQASTSGLQFVPVAPCRIADTRNANGPFGGPAIPGLGSRDFPIPQSPCNIPSSAVAYSLNVTVVPRGPLGFITLWPTDTAKPLASTLNAVDGRIKANAAIVPAGTNGAVSLYATEPTDAILDINGYFTRPQSNGLVFYPLTPCRALDTRPNSAMAARESRTFGLRGYCGIPGNASAVSVNATVVPRGPFGFLTLWPSDVSQPVVSTLNAVTGVVTANAAIVPLSTSGQINAYVTEQADLILDVNGYFAPPGGADGLQFYPLTPCRISDTRNPAGPLGGPGLTAAVERVVPVFSGPCGLPLAARAYAMNATVVPSGVFGFLTLWPSGSAQPLVSTLNAVDGIVTSNMAIVRAGTSGSISMYGSNAGHVLFDVTGYFAP